MEYLYETVRDTIKRRILEGLYPAGSRLPGSRDFSAEFDTTAVTVDRALADLVDEGLVKRIPRSGTYVTKPEERPEAVLRTERAAPGLVGVVAFDTTVSVFWSAVVKAMEDALLSFGFHQVVGHSDGQVEKALRYIEDLAAKGIEGFIYIPISVPYWTKDDYERNNAAVVDHLEKTGLPYILFDRGLECRRAPLVSAENYRFSREVVRGLLERGCAKPLCVTSDYSLASGERERAFVDACAERGIADGEDRIVRVEADRITHANYELLESIAFSRPDTDGFFTINSSLGNGLVDLLSRHPEHAETPLAGFEDYAMRNRSRFFLVAKSSVYDMGYVAGELLSRKIRERDALIWKQAAIEIRLPCALERIHA